MDRNIIEQRLVSYAHWCAASQGYKFGPGAENQIDYMAHQSVTKMFGDKLPKRLTPRHQAMLTQAEAAFAMLVASMIQSSKRIRGYAARHPNEIGEETIAQAEMSLCPLFPIC